MILQIGAEAFRSEDFFAAGRRVSLTSSENSSSTKRISALLLSGYAMKRLIAGGLFLLVVAITIFLWWENRDSLSASQIAPVECLAYVELPNIIQTAKRWPDSDLCRILGEPSVQRFLREPISKAPANYRTAWNSFTALRCSALFFGMTDPDGDRWICGLQTSLDQPSCLREIGNISNALFGQNV